MGAKELGRFGEELAVSYLRKNGFKVLKRNFRCKIGEIDIIAEKGGEVYFVEVKTRKSNSFGSPFESITLNKQRQVSKIAQVFLKSYKRDINCHFSAMGISLSSNSNPSVKFLPDAFEEC